MAILMLTPVSPSDLALVWTPSPRDLTLPPRDMFLTTATDITPTDTTTARGPPMKNLLHPHLLLSVVLLMAILMLTPVSPSDLALVWTPSPRALTSPPRAMFLTPDFTTARGPPMLRLRLRPSPRLSMATTVTLTVLATTWAMLATATLATPSLMVESLPP